MLNKPIKIKQIAMIFVALIFWLSGASLFAQNKQSSNTEPEKKQVPTAQPQVTLSNQEPNTTKVDEVTAKRNAQEEKRKQDQAIESKKQASAKESAAVSKTATNSASTSSKVTNTSTQSAVSNQPIKSQDIQKDWEIKKAKISADMKSKGASQNDIDKQIAAMEKQLNINNNSNK